MVSVKITLAAHNQALVNAILIIKKQPADSKILNEENDTECYLLKIFLLIIIDVYN